VPEIEMPGHAQAIIAAYPSLGNFGDTIKPWTMWGVTNSILNPSDTTIAFMQDVLTEVMQVFPGPFIHIGGDEAPKTQWRNSPRAQRLIDAFAIRDPADSPTAFKSEDRLQSWFTTKMDSFLSSRGRRLVGWDEILEGGLAPNAVVMSWRGLEGGITAARAGHDVVMTPNQYTYFDHYQASRDSEPLSIGGFLPIDSVYLYEPVPADLEPQYAKHILGAQAQVWTEYIEGPKQVEYMAYPRAAALAEVLWTPPNRRDLRDFKRRLAEDKRRLNALDVNFRP
jgi:hexosaminidase